MTSSTYDRAMKAFEAGDAESTQALVDPAIENTPSSLDGVSLRFLRGNAYEWGGYPGGVDLEKAYADYKALEEWTPTLGSDVLVAAARVLFDIDGTKNKDEIQRLCKKAINLDKHVHAKMLLGLLNQKVLMNSREARKWYLSAYFGGLPWGLRYYADSHKHEGRTVIASLAHLFATISSPFLVMLTGARGAFSQHP
jgi:hypothetical protein